MVASLGFLIVLQSTNLWKDFTIQSASDLILLYALSSLNFIAFVIFAFIFLRSIIKLVRERRTFELGAQIKTRLLIYFFAISLLPIIAMAVFSYLFMNRALERWFTQIPANVMAEARKVQDQSIEDRSARLDEAVKMLAASINGRPVESELASIAAAGNLAHISIVDNRTGEVWKYERQSSGDEAEELTSISERARAGDLTDPTFRDGRGFDAAIAQMTDGRRLIVIPEPLDERSVSQIVENSFVEFDRLKQQQVIIRQVGLLTLGVLTFLLIFASTWIAFYVARGITGPIKALAEGADEIARGNLGHRVDVLAEDELALLVTTFNEMSSKLEANSQELKQRRRYIETVLETLPTGVVSFDVDNCISTMNRAAFAILRVGDEVTKGTHLDKIVADPGDAEVLSRILARARRVGHASDQIKLSGGSHSSEEWRNEEVTVALTASKLPSDDAVVLVLEDLSDLIAAQRASAWQEVARRMAHEIKNPLTPIQLSAERIAKRFSESDLSENGGPRSADNGSIRNVVSESTSTILREVASLKSMVDEFSQYARLPDLSLDMGDINAVITDAVSVFAGSYEHIEIEKELDPDLPPALIDPDQLKRVFINLIQNAVEAFDGAYNDARVVISSRIDRARDLIIVEIADNAKGFAKGDLQKLFQPYFSTKQRGTGLGLAIVHRIIVDHRARIRAVSNTPRGAKFTIEIPVNL